MKTLIKHTIPILVILIWVVLAIIIGLASCSKDSPASVTSKAGQSKQSPKLVFSGSKFPSHYLHTAALNRLLFMTFPSNGIVIQSVHATRIEQYNYGFDLVMK
jgi:hypothetical protein